MTGTWRLLATVMVPPLVAMCKPLVGILMLCLFIIGTLIDKLVVLSVNYLVVTMLIQFHKFT